MARGSRAVILLLMCCVILLSRPENAAAQQQPRHCGAGDLAALRGFSAGLDAAVDGWPIANASDDWCCDWPGVVCDAAAGGGAGAVVVVGLVLPNRTLQGEVAASLAGLAALRVLNLSSNALRGTIPAGLLRLRRLEVLDVSGNSLAGGLGAGVAIELPAVRVFNVSGNAFNGSHPVLPGAGNLTTYDASGNNLVGPVDAAALCRESPAVRVLRLSMNSLSGAFPVGFGQCRSLAELSLDGNGIGGTLPDDLFGITSLQLLSLHTNSISGGLSPRLRNLSIIVRLDLSFNAFSGPLPDVFDTLTGLQELSAPSNQLSGELPATLSRCRQLRVLNLRNNSFVGDIGLDFRALKNLGYLDLGINSFSGTIPASLPECRGMTALNLGRNKLTGEIPASFANFSSLSFLSLTGNSFSNVSSALRTLQGLPNLTSLVLTKNFHGGEEMPSDDAGIAGFPSIQVLVIANCELHGAIPSWIAGLRKLRVLDLSWNRLAGPIPPWLGQLDRLFYLDISNNSLQGEIPGSLTRMPGFVAGGAHGGDDDVAQVQDFPFFMRRNTSMQGRQYNQVNSFPPSLVLGHNNLTGGVPAALGALTKLHIVDLSWNKLSGPIPSELSGMASLESLDLSHNWLSGTIPASLTRLSFLSHFDVSHNNLSGEVPVGGQFSTFSRGDFEGNPLLCGIHVARCAPKNPPQVDGGGRDKDRSASAGVVAAISVGTALLLAVAAVVTWRVWSKRQEDNARVAADDDSGSLESAAKSTLVLVFPAEDSDDGDSERTMTLEDVMKATCNFDESRIVGCGGFGMVYRATLPDGREVAVKRLSGDFWQMEREFSAEVETLSRVRHRNLVPLQGYCRAGKDRLLIYPYMENGSLDLWLHERQQQDGGGAALPWPARLGIARGAARGLAHLHASSEPRVLHRDIKSSNILLDARLEPRLADFGLARLVLPTDTHVTTDLVGTLGYIPPEYGHSSVATYRGDVYSLGVVLLELVTGRRPVDMARPVGGGRDVTSWAVRMRREARGEEVIDASVAERRHREEAAKMLEVACACVSENPKSRPTAQQVVEWLDAIATSALPSTDTEHSVNSCNWR
ncbi:Phytosulfokine receptor 1 [Dichanthelium oligosanthes]|uniref:non-specific serine/threonine protein kinase n=1 Tax=Dichanthelium oligosanthes TaxID=888268 RepID=A0A1E5VII7_9POAL|nr:Phytosulfokine receptor 1 [Dichanthelium oligosanthes]